MRKLVIILVCMFGIVVLINAYTNDRPGASTPETASVSPDAGSPSDN